jgi:hypothetical protein
VDQIVSLVILVSILAAFGLVGAAAERFGYDSRPRIDDNHNR